MGETIDKHLNNSAGRLWLILHHSMHNGNASDSILNVWANYFGATAGPTSELYQNLSRLIVLPEQIREDVDKLVDPVVDKEILLRGLPAATSALDYVENLRAPMSELRSCYTDTTLTELEVCSSILSSSSTHNVTDQDLDDLRKLADDLIDLLTNDNDIDAELKKVLLNHCFDIIRAIDLFKISGIEGVLDEIDRYTGRIFRMRDTMNNQKPAVKNFAVQITFWAVTLTQVSTAVGSSIDTVKKALGVG